MQRLIWSLASFRDLRGIEAFIGVENPRAALAAVRAIRIRADQLRRFPATGPTLTDALRSLRVRATPYVLICRIRPGRVEVVRVRHAREDWRPE